MRANFQYIRKKGVKSISHPKIALQLYQPNPKSLNLKTKQKKNRNILFYGSLCGNFLFTIETQTYLLQRWCFPGSKTL